MCLSLFKNRDELISNIIVIEGIISEKYPKEGYEELEKRVAEKFKAITYLVEYVKKDRKEYIDYIRKLKK